MINVLEANVPLTVPAETIWNVLPLPGVKPSVPASVAPPRIAVPVTLSRLNCPADVPLRLACRVAPEASTTLPPTDSVPIALPGAKVAPEATLKVPAI